MRKMMIYGLLLMAAGGVQAQEVLSLQQCRELALENNKQVAAAAFQTRGAEYTVKSYWANFFPNITATGSAAYSDMDGTLGIGGGKLPIHLPIMPGLEINHVFDIPTLSMNYEVKSLYMAGVSVEQPLYMGGKIRSAYRISKMGRKMAQLNERLTESEVIVETDEAYALLVKATEMQKVAQSYNAVLQELMKNVESACKHGLKSNNDRLKVQVKLNESELKIKKAENAVRLATMNLCHVIGKPLISQITVNDEFPAINHQLQLQVNDITVRPEYALIENKVGIAKQQVKLSRSELLPKVGVKGSYDYLNGLKLNGNKVFDGGGFAVMMSVSVPIFHFGERVNKMRAAKMDLEKARMEQSNLNEKMLLELTQTANNLDEAKLEQQIAERSLDQAAENMKVSKGEYDAGLESLSDYLEAQTLWQQAYAAKVDANFQLYLSYVKYLKASGTLN